jgi:hypothetical protein
LRLGKERVPSRDYVGRGKVPVAGARGVWVGRRLVGRRRAGHRRALRGRGGLGVGGLGVGVECSRHEKHPSTWESDLSAYLKLL